MTNDESMWDGVDATTPERELYEQLQRVRAEVATLTRMADALDYTNHAGLERELRRMADDFGRWYDGDTRCNAIMDKLAADRGVTR